MIDKEEVLEIIKEIRIKLPDEIKQAAWIKEERQRILAQAQKMQIPCLRKLNISLKN